MTDHELAAAVRKAAAELNAALSAAYMTGLRVECEIFATQAVHHRYELPQIDVTVSRELE